MTDKPENPPAFPTDNVYAGKGMELRDYFAAAALQGMLSLKEGCALEKDMLAVICFRMADAMLKARQS